MPLVLAEDEAARQLGLAGRHATPERILGTASDLVAVGERKRTTTAAMPSTRSRDGRPLRIAA